MINEDYVAVAKKQCPICGKIHSHNCEILIHKQLKAISEEETFSGQGLCEEHDKLREEGYIALIEVKNAEDSTMLTAQQAKRTGRLVHIKRDIYNMIFNVPEDGKIVPIAFISIDAFEYLLSIQEGAEDDTVH